MDENISDRKFSDVFHGILTLLQKFRTNKVIYFEFIFAYFILKRHTFIDRALFKGAWSEIPQTIIVEDDENEFHLIRYHSFHQLTLSPHCFLYKRLVNDTLTQ